MVATSPISTVSQKVFNRGNKTYKKKNFFKNPRAVTGWSNIFDQLGGPDSRPADWSRRLRQVISQRSMTGTRISL